MTVPHPSRTVRLAALTAVAGLALGGCSMFSPQTTTNVTYAPSDGVQGEVGEVAVRNLFVVTAEQGGPADLVGSLFNSTDEDVSVEVVVRKPLEGADGTEPPNPPAATETIQVDAGSSVSLGPEADEQVSIASLDITPGRVAEVTFIGAGGNLLLRAPVLDGTLPEYADLISDEG